MRIGGLGTSRPKEEELVPGATGSQLGLGHPLCSWGLCLAQPGDAQETGPVGVLAGVRTLPFLKHGCSYPEVRKGAGYTGALRATGSREVPFTPILELRKMEFRE